MILSLRLGLREFGWDFDTTAQPHDFYNADSQMASFSQDGSGHTKNVLASLFHSGRKWSRVVHLRLQSVTATPEHTTLTFSLLIVSPFNNSV